MLGYEETMVLLDEMKPHYDDGFTSSERSTIENLYNTICRKPIRRSGCSDCYRDAYIEVVTTLKRLGKMPKESNYMLKAGAVLHEFGSADFYTLDNIPDEFAEKWLDTHPSDYILFERMPSDWKERVEKRKIASESKGIAETDKPSGAEKEEAHLDFADKEPIEKEQPVEQDKPSGRRGRPAATSK